MNAKLPTVWRHITASHRRTMHNAYRLDVARFIAEVAQRRELVTYGDVAEKFGGIARGYGDCLGGIAIRLREHGHPILPVIVVNQDTRMPSTDAVLYLDLGLTSDDLLRAEQERVWDYDWAPVLLNRGS